MEFKKVPNNLIALTCNAVRRLILCSGNSYLIFGACYYRLSVRCTIGQACSPTSCTLRSMYFFSVMYMAHICTRWDALMSFQEALEEGATDYFQETKEEIWEYIR